MRQIKLMMGMPITVEVVSSENTAVVIDEVFNYFTYVDNKFSTYKIDSEISQINQGVIQPADYSDDMKEVLVLSEQTKQITKGYFDIKSRSGILDPSGLVKGWAIYNAAKIIENHGFGDFYVEAGGDIEVRGQNAEHEIWRVGIRNPFNWQKEVIKVLRLKDQGVATSGTYIRGQHIYNPKQIQQPITEVVSLTVIGPNIYEADRFATAAFAMGKGGINFIESLSGLEGYMIDAAGIATMTSKFEKYIVLHA